MDLQDTKMDYEGSLYTDKLLQWSLPKDVAVLLLHLLFLATPSTSVVIQIPTVVAACCSVPICECYN